MALVAIGEADAVCPIAQRLRAGCAPVTLQRGMVQRVTGGRRYDGDASKAMLASASTRTTP